MHPAAAHPAARTPPTDRQDRTDATDCAESPEPTDSQLPAENSDIDEPTLPMEAKEPTLPMERNEPAEAMDSAESRDHSDSHDRVLMDPAWHRCAPAGTTPAAPSPEIVRNSPAPAGSGGAPGCRWKRA